MRALLPSRPSSNPSGGACNRVPTRVSGTRCAPLAAKPKMAPAAAAIEIAQAVARQAPSALPLPAPGLVSHSSASMRLDTIDELLLQSVPNKLDSSVLSQHAQRLAAARFQLTGLNADGKCTQTDLRFLRERHDTTETKPMRVRLLENQFALNQQAFALLGRVLPKGIAPGHGITQHLELEDLPKKIQAQFLLACMPSHLLNNSQLKAWGLPSVRKLIAMANKPESQLTTEPDSTLWPWKAIHERLLRAQGDDLLVGRSRYRNIVPGLSATYGQPKGGNRSGNTFGARLQRLLKRLFHHVSSEVSASKSNAVLLTGDPPPRVVPLTKANLDIHNGETKKPRFWLCGVFLCR